MTEARVERSEADPWLAAEFLKRAKQFVADASEPDLSLESQQVLNHNAVVCACDALLAINARTITGSDGGHRLRLTEAEQLLGHEHRDLFDRLDEARSTRNDVSYHAGLAAPPEVQEAAAAAQELLALIEARVEPHLPDWSSQL